MHGPTGTEQSGTLVEIADDKHPQVRVPLSDGILLTIRLNLHTIIRHDEPDADGNLVYSVCGKVETEADRSPEFLSRVGA